MTERATQGRPASASSFGARPPGAAWGMVQYDLERFLEDGGAEGLPSAELLTTITDYLALSPEERKEVEAVIAEPAAAGVPFAFDLAKRVIAAIRPGL